MIAKLWHEKIDPYGRRHLDEGLPSGGLELTVRLARGAARGPELRAAGMVVQYTLDDLVVGRVADRAALEAVAGLSFVQEVQVSQTLHDEGAPTSY